MDMQVGNPGWQSMPAAGNNPPLVDHRAQRRKWRRRRRGRI